MVDVRVQVEYCYEVYGSIIQAKKKGIKVYKNKKNAQRYMSQCSINQATMCVAVMSMSVKLGLLIIALRGLSYAKKN